MKGKEYSIGSGKTAVCFPDSIDEIPRDDYHGVIYVFDGNTRKLFPGIPSEVSVILPPGEQEKNWDSVDKIFDKALNLGLARDSLFVGVGGGVVCDLAGAAASLYMRGAGLVLVPTTLLAMADASLGGKTGFDYRGYKNIIGTFYPAKELHILPEVLLSLPEREYRSGLAEIIKHGMLQDNGIWSILKNNSKAILERDLDVMRNLVSRSLDVKGWFVEKDFRERGIRRILNFGHTFGHALESVTGFKTVSHGEAVVWGIIMALKTGLLLKETDKHWAEEAEEIINLYGYDTVCHRGISVDALLEAMKHDKKKKGGEVRFVLQRKQGETFTQVVDEGILRSALKIQTEKI